MSVAFFETGIEGCRVETQPMFGTTDGAVFHMLPGGAQNPEGFGQILDVYACTAVGKGTVRGAHTHRVLDEFFFPATGAALWILSDQRPESPTYKKTAAVILSIDPVEAPAHIPAFSALQGTFPRLRVPRGVYHAFTPFTDERVMITALGSTPHDAKDYEYPAWEEIEGLEAVVGAEWFALLKQEPKKSSSS